MTRETDKTCAIQRTHVPTMDDILGWAFPVLDHGFVRVIDYMGDDTAVVEAAKVSYGKPPGSAREQASLIDYLMRHRHTSPFEMCEVKLHVKLPIFVARQWVRHRTANMNEYSLRYSEAPDEYYFPRPEDLARQSTANKQGRGERLTAAEAESFLASLRAGNNWQQASYRDARDDYDLSREIARIGLSVNLYTEFYWKIDLHNLFHFLGLRADPHAQKEIRDYADVILGLVERWVPVSTAAFKEHRLNAVTLSATAAAFVEKLVRSPAHPMTQAASYLGDREWADLCKWLAVLDRKADPEGAL